MNVVILFRAKKSKATMSCGEVFLGCLSYADDIIIISLSVVGVQKVHWSRGIGLWLVLLNIYAVIGRRSNMRWS